SSVPRAKIVAPLADAVRLIDDDALDLHLAHVLLPEQVALPFGRQEQDVELAGRRRAKHALLTSLLLIAVEERSAQAESIRALALLLHQRLQGLEHEHDTPRPRARGECLVAQRLSVARRNDEDHPPPGEQM